MLLQTLGATGVRDGAFRALCAFGALWLSLFLFSTFLSLYATARFWEPYVKDGGSIVVVGPVIVIALLSGAIAGALLGALFSNHGTRVAGFAAALNIAWSVVLYFKDPPSVGSDFISPIALAVGFVLGSCAVTGLRRGKK
jgi:hypothetical protein